MRVAVIGSRGVPASHGGVERHVEELYARLAGRGVDATIFCRRHYVEPRRERVRWERLLHKGRYRGMRLVVSRVPVVKGLEAFLHSFLATLRSVWGRHDIVHYHSLGPAFFQFIPRMFGRRVVVTVHALDWQREKWGRGAKAFLRLCERQVARRSPRVICVSRDLQGHFRQAWGRDVDCIPNGVEISSPIHESTLAPWGLEAGKYILFFGRLTPEKGVHTLIEAFQRLNPEARRGTRLVIAGGGAQAGGYEENLKRMCPQMPAGELVAPPARLSAGGEFAAQASPPNILFTGYVYGADLVRLISNCRFVVNPSTLEGLPIAVLEANSLGKRVLASDIPPHHELGLEGEWLFAPGDVDALARQLEQRLAGPESPWFDESLVENVRGEYDWDRIAETTKRLLDWMMRPRQTAPGVIPGG